MVVGRRKKWQRKAERKLHFVVGLTPALHGWRKVSKRDLAEDDDHFPTLTVQETLRRVA